MASIATISSFVVVALVALAFVRSLLLARGSFLSEREEEESGVLDGGDQALGVEVPVHDDQLLWEAEIALQRLQLQRGCAGLEESTNVLTDSQSRRSRSPVRRQSVFGRGRNHGMGNGDDARDVDAAPTPVRVLGAENYVSEHPGLADESGRYGQYRTGALNQDTSRSFVHFRARPGDGFAPPVPPTFSPVERRFSGYRPGPGLPRVVSPSPGSRRGSTRRPEPEEGGECFPSGVHAAGSATGCPLAPGVDEQGARGEARMCSRVSKASYSKGRGGLGAEEAGSGVAKRKAPGGTSNDGEVHGGEGGARESGTDGTSFGSPGSRVGKLSSRWFGISRVILGGERWRRITGAGAACRAPVAMEARRGPEHPGGGTRDVEGISAERKEELEHGKENGPRSRVPPSNAGADNATPDCFSKLPVETPENHRCGEMKVRPGETSSISHSSREQKSLSRVSECTTDVACPGSHVPDCAGVSDVSPAPPAVVGSRSEVRSRPKQGGSLAAIFGRSGVSSRTAGEQSTGGNAPAPRRPSVPVQAAPVGNGEVTRRVPVGEVATATQSSIVVDASASSPGRHMQRSRDGVTVGMSVASPEELRQDAAAIEGVREGQGSGGNPGGSAVSVRSCGDGRGSSSPSGPCSPQGDGAADAAAGSSIEDDALGEMERGGEGDAAASGPGESSPYSEGGGQGELRRGSAGIVRRLSLALGLRAEGEVGSRGGKRQAAAVAVAEAEAEAGGSLSFGDLRPPLLLPGLGVRRRRSYAVCPVCLEVFQPMDSVTIITCGHGFHWDCVQPWLERSAHCPCCRRDLNVLSAMMVRQRVRSTSQDDGADDPLARHSSDYGNAYYDHDDGNEGGMNVGSTFSRPVPTTSWSRSYEDSDLVHVAALVGAANGPGRGRPRRSSWAPSAGVSEAFLETGPASEESQWVANRAGALRRSLYSSSLRVTNVSAGRIYSLGAW